jgi:DNA-directed RNA polymerase sigma subunit (sigma70/sigma32)
MSIVAASTDPTARRQQIALDHLALCREEMDQARRSRQHYVTLARQYGLTHQAIGDALGVSEARIRQILAGR